MLDFAVRAKKARSMSHALNLIVFPYVEDANKEAWEQYSVKNDAWVDESLIVQQTDPTFHGTVIDTWNKSGSIFNDYGPVTKPGPFLPTWQSYPIVTETPPYNWDISQSAEQVPVSAVLRSHQVVISLTANLVSTKMYSHDSMLFIFRFVCLFLFFYSFSSFRTLLIQKLMLMLIEFADMLEMK